MILKYLVQTSIKATSAIGVFIDIKNHIWIKMCFKKFGNDKRSSQKFLNKVNKNHQYAVMEI